ncbi:MAG: hypothetical protein ABIR70_05210 [Bryobacteraceae bacterium]
MEVSSNFNGMQRHTQLHTYCAIAIAILAWPAYAQTGLGLSPLRVETAIEAGTTVSNALVLSNVADRTTSIRAEVLDFYVDSEQEPQFVASSQDAYSCRTWLRVSPTDVEIAPGQRVLVRYTFRIPEEIAAGTYYCAAAFSTAPIPDEKVSGLSVNVRAITSFYMTVGRTRPEGTLRRLYVEALPNDSTRSRIVCEVENTGSYVWRPIGGLSIVSAEGEVLHEIPFRSMPVLPGRKQRFLFPVTEEIPQGADLRVRMDIGGGETQEGHFVPAASILPR